MVTMGGIQMKALSLVLILCLLIPATAYSQVAELNNVSTPTQTQTQTPVSTMSRFQSGWNL